MSKMTIKVRESKKNEDMLSRRDAMEKAKQIVSSLKPSASACKAVGLSLARVKKAFADFNKAYNSKSYVGMSTYDFGDLLSNVANYAYVGGDNSGAMEIMDLAKSALSESKQSKGCSMKRKIESLGKKTEKDARMSQPWGDNELVATEDELASMDKEDPESAYLMRAMQYLRKDLRYVYDLNEEKHLIDRLLNLYDNGVDYKTAVRRIINNDNKLTNRLRLTSAESCTRSEKRTVQPPSYDVYTYDELSDEAKEKVKDMFLHWRGEDSSIFTEDCENVIAELFPNSDLNVQYDLSYSQGDGFNTYGKLRATDLIDVDLGKYPLNGTSIKPLSDKDAIKAACEKAGIFDITLENNSRHCYSLADRIELDRTYEDELSEDEIKLLDELETFAQDVIGEINSKFEDNGYDYFYEMSEEEVRDMADANEYEFTEDGEIA